MYHTCVVPLAGVQESRVCRRGTWRLGRPPAAAWPPPLLALHAGAARAAARAAAWDCRMGSPHPSSLSTP